MAAVEVLAHAASATCGWPRSHRSTRTGHSLPRDRTGQRQNKIAIVCLDVSLGLIAEAWVNLRSSQSTPCASSSQPTPLIIPDFCSPKWWSQARHLPRDQDEPEASLPDPSSTDSAAQRRSLPEDDSPYQCCAPVAQGHRRNDRREGELLTDPTMDLIDFSAHCDEGVVQAAGKKKKKATPYIWTDDPGDTKDDGSGGAGDGADGNKDQDTGGDSAGGSGSAGGGDDGGDKKDDERKDEAEPVEDDIWDFGGAGSKKKDKKKAADADATDAFGLHDAPPTDFHEIKLDDAGGGHEEDSLDLNFLPKAEKITAGITAWTSSWGAGSWGWGGLKSPGGTDIPKPAEEEKPIASDLAQNNPWSIDRAKPKKKETSSFSFGALDEGDGNFDFMSSAKPKEKEESFGFIGSTKSSEKKDVGSSFSWGAPSAKKSDDFWGNIGDKKPEEEEQPADAEASDDIWGFSSSKKDKKKNSTKIAVVEEPSMTEEAPPAAPDPPQTSDSPAYDAAEAALIAEEEAEMRKLQTKKDIGSKLTKKQQDRLKVLTEHAKTRAEAAPAAAAEVKAEDPSADTGEVLDPPPSDDPAAPADSVVSQAEADEKAQIIQDEEEEMFILRSKKKLKKTEKDRLALLQERADERAREAEQVAVPEVQDEVEPDTTVSVENDMDEPQFDMIDSAQFEVDENARVIREEEEELADLRAKKKPKKSDKDRIRILEERADERAREAEAVADMSFPDSSGDATESKTDETATTSMDDAFGDFDKDEAQRVIEDEEMELEMLLSKMKPKKTDKARIKELQDNKTRREQEAAEKASAEPEVVKPPPVADAPVAEDITQDSPKVEDDAEAKRIEEEEAELTLLLAKPRMKKTEKARFKVLQDNKEQREWEAAQKAEVVVDVPSVDDLVIEEPPLAAPESEPVESEPVDEAALQEAKEDAEVAAEESELSDLLSKARPKRAEKARIKELQDRKDQREWEAAEKENSADAPPAEVLPIVEEPPAAPEADPVDEAALEKEKADAVIAAEESELSDLLSKPKPKRSEKARLKELQDRKDARDKEAQFAVEKAEEDARLASEATEQAASDLEEKQKREAEEKLATEIAAEEAEISSLEAKKKLKKPDKDRLADLKLRRDKRASAEAAKLAEDLMKEDADNDGGKEKLSWADDDPAQDNGAGDDWMDWAGDSSKKDTTSSKADNLIDLGSPEEKTAVPDPPAAATEPSGFDFGWGKAAPKSEPADDAWGFGSSSKKKKSKNAAPPAEIVEDTMVASTTITADPVTATDDKGDADFWATFGGSKKSNDKKADSSKDDLVAEPPLPISSLAGMDLTAAEDGIGWGDLSTSTELSKSKSSDKESKKSSSKEPKLSKKELEKIEKEKKKADKEQKAREEKEAAEQKAREEKEAAEQKAREEQEAADAAELAKLLEEERLEAEAEAEKDRLAQEETDRIRKEEEEKQAALDAIAKEETDLAALQAKKDSGKKLLKKDKERYDKLAASCQARADEKAAQEAAEQAARDEAERLQREAEEQAQKEAIEKEESELKDLQKKKDSGRKLLKKDKERYDLLSANKKARKQAEKDAQAAIEAEAVVDEPAPDVEEFVDPLEKDLAQLDSKDLDELDAFLSAPPKAAPVTKAAEVDPFSFWGASKKPSSSSKKDKSVTAEALLEAATSGVSVSVSVSASGSGSGGTKDKKAAAPVPGAWSPSWNESVWPPSPPLAVDQPKRETQSDKSSGAAAPITRKAGAGTFKIADRLKALLAVSPPPPPAPADEAIPPPPPPAPVAPADIKVRRISKTVDIPGSFPDEFEEGHPDDIIEVIEMPSRPKKSSKKSSSKSKTDDKPIPIPPPPPAVPDAPIPPPPGVVVIKKESKKERPKINRDGGSNWGTWTASTPRDKEKKSSSKSKPAEEMKKADEAKKSRKEGRSPVKEETEEPKKSRKEERSPVKEETEEPKKLHKEERSPEKEEKLSSKGSSSDKAERVEKKDKAADTPRTKLKSVFASTPPISRNASTRDKRHKDGRSSRRPSVDVNSGMVSPPPEEVDVGSKAAKILGIGAGLSRSMSKRKNSVKPADDEDVVMVGATDAESPEKPSRRRPSKLYHRDDDIVMVEAADAIPPPPPAPLKRSNTTGSTKKSFGGLFGGILSKPEPKRRTTYHTDGEDAATDADAEARKAARRARRVEREVAEKSKDEVRRDKRRKQEDEAEAQRQAEKEARRAERRAARERESSAKPAADDKDDRRHRKRTDRGEKDLEADAEAEARRARRERRKARAAGESDRENDDERRRRRAKRDEGKHTHSRHRTDPVDGDDFVYSRPGAKASRRHSNGHETMTAAPKAAEGAPAWPHSGTSSWVKDHSDAGPPPDDAGGAGEGPQAEEGGEAVDEDAARRERRRRRRYGDVEVDGAAGGEKRRKKGEGERSDGSAERPRRERKASLFAADGGGGGERRASGFGGLWKKLTRA